MHNTEQPRHFYGERTLPLNINGIQSRSRAFSGDNNGAIMFPADDDKEISKLAKDRYAVVEIQAPVADGENTRLSRKDLTISEIVNAMPETLPRDFLSPKPDESSGRNGPEAPRHDESLSIEGLDPPMVHSATK